MIRLAIVSSYSPTSTVRDRTYRVLIIIIISCNCNSMLRGENVATLSCKSFILGQLGKLLANSQSRNGKTKLSASEFESAKRSNAVIEIAF